MASSSFPPWALLPFTSMRSVFRSCSCVFGVSVFSATCQAYYLMASYTPLPSGSLGQSSPSASSSSSSSSSSSGGESASSHLQSASSQASGVGSRLSGSASTSKRNFSHGVTSVSSPESAVSRCFGVELIRPSSKAGASDTKTTTGWFRGFAANAQQQARARVLFVGDSLVTGMGARGKGNDDDPGPLLPQGVARAMAEGLQVDVTWHAAGVDGGDARTVRADAVPRIISSPVSAQGVPTVVVVLVGLNDWKHALRGRTPLTFRDDLRELLCSIRDTLGPDAKNAVVLLPRLPLHLAPAIRNLWPLSWFARHAAAQWERQKQAMCDEFQGDLCVVVPPYEYDGGGGGWSFDGVQKLSLDDASSSSDDDLASSVMWAEDGVHPSAEGYRTWARHLARQAIEHLTALHGAEKFNCKH
ncbi:SGNH hydrolase-type esterase domain-containing protein [Pseudoscourfieldia marina]